MKYKAIIFDLDGTIIDTDMIWKKANKNLLAARGVTLTQEQEQKLDSKVRGLAIHKSCKIIKDIANLSDSVEDLITEEIEIARKLHFEGIKFIHGFLPFHNKIKSINLKKGIATNADDSTLSITKNKLNLENLFGGHIYNISHVNNICKPAPDLYLYAAKRLKVDPKECIVIEDSDHGIQAAKSAGMFCIGINTSQNRKNVQNADIIVSGYDEIDHEKLLKKELSKASSV